MEKDLPFEGIDLYLHKVSKVFNAIGEEIKENGIIDEKIFKEGLRRLGIEEVELHGNEKLLRIGKGRFKDMIKNSLGRDVEFKQGDYAIFRIFTENKEPYFVLAKIGEETKGEYRFGGEEFYKRLGTDKFYIKIEDVIKNLKENLKDWYNKLIKGKVEEKEIGDHIIKILSEDKIKIINQKLNIEKTLELKNTEWHFIDQGRFLGIKGDIEVEFDGIKVKGTKVAIVTNGDGEIKMEILFETHHGDEIIDIDLKEDRLKFRYDHGGGQKSLHLVYYVIKSQDVKIDSSGIYINRRIAKEFHEVAKNARGLIGEVLSAIMHKKTDGSIKSIEVVGGVASPEGKADLHIEKINGKNYPDETKSTGDYTIEDIKTNLKRVKELFDKRRNEAIGQITWKFEKSFYIDSEYGTVTIIGIPKDILEASNSEYVKIDVLRVKVDRYGNIIEYIYIPEWYKP